MTLTTSAMRDLYRRRAARYDWSVKLFRLCGLDIERYRQEAVAALELRPGDRVVELGCGTGLNFASLQQRIGPQGKIIGVDLTDAMLDVARARVAREHWSNVQLVQANVADWNIPDGVSAVVSTLALTLLPEYDSIIQRASHALRAGGRVAVLDLKQPARWPMWLVRLAAWLNKPFGVSLEIAERHPWESIRHYLTETEFREYYFGALYLCVGRKDGPS
jgi:ubiquinone/menaquinone biosynthesis C-methylase UbiE